MKKIIGCLILILCLFTPAYAANLPDYTGYTNDSAQVLSEKSKSSLDAIALQVERKTSAQIAILTVPTTEPFTIEEYAVKLFEKWGIGQKGKDNGVLILVAVNDKAVKIETGYGLEGALPDAICSQIIHQIMIPEFKKGSIEKGLISGIIAVAEIIAKEYNIELVLDKETLSAAGKLGSGSSASMHLFFFILFIIIFIWFFQSLKRGGRGPFFFGGRGGRSGGSGGGFGGFGGGRSGGGGASGRW